MTFVCLWPVVVVQLVGNHLLIDFLLKKLLIDLVGV